MRSILLVAVATMLLLPPAVAAQKQSAAEAVAAYGAAWSEQDPDKRLTLLEKAWSEDGVYSDPTAEVKGRQALADHIGGFLAQSNGARIVLTSAVDLHHEIRLRFSWKMVAPDGQTTVAEGFDYGELDADGRLRLIVGFFGPFPPLDE